jgi:hypothetical protein
VYLFEISRAEIMCLFRCKNFSCKKVCALRGLCIAIDNLCHSIDLNREEFSSVIELEDLFIQLSEVFLNWKRERDEYRSRSSDRRDNKNSGHAHRGGDALSSSGEEVSRKTKNETN